MEIPYGKLKRKPTLPTCTPMLRVMLMIEFKFAPKVIEALALASLLNSTYS